MIRIPLPFELGQIFGAAPMAALDTYYFDDPKAVKGLVENIIGNFTPSITPKELNGTEKWSSVPVDTSIVVPLGLSLFPIRIDALVAKIKNPSFVITLVLVVVEGRTVTVEGTLAKFRARALTW